MAAPYVIVVWFMVISMSQNRLKVKSLFHCAFPSLPPVPSKFLSNHFPNTDTSGYSSQAVTESSIVCVQTDSNEIIPDQTIPEVGQCLVWSGKREIKEEHGSQSIPVISAVQHSPCNPLEPALTGWSVLKSQCFSGMPRH